MIPTDHYLRFERVDDVRETERGIEASLHGERLQVDLVTDDVVRIRISRGGSFDEQPTYAVCVDPMAVPVEHRVEYDEGVVRLRSSGLQLTLGLDPFRIDVHRPDGSSVVETAADDDGRSWAYATLNDAFTVRRRCRQEDAVYGLGEKTGRHNRKGRDFTMWNLDVLSPERSAEFTSGRDPADPRSVNSSTEFDPYYVSIPFFHHLDARTGAVGSSFLDNGYRTYFDFSRPEEYRIHAAGGQYVEYVFAGPRLPDVLAAYTHLTGRVPPPPLWSLGFQQCRWFDYTQESVEALAARHRERQVPCDALWLDIDYMDGYRVFTWDEEKFPDPAGMLAKLDAQGFRVVTIIDPGVKHDPGYWVYDQALDRDVLCRTEGGDHYIGQVWPGNTVFPDFVTEEARTWWGDLNAAHVASGLAGIWNDMNEPATGSIDPLAMRFDRGRDSHERWHNQYALLMAMGTTEGLRAARPDRRTFVLSRAGFAGIQRYAANWMGDNLSRWDHLRLSVAMACGLGLSGQPFVGADVGGFMGNANAELCVRWTQYGALTPFFRNHSGIGNVDQYAWSWGASAETQIRAAIELRYRLLPYLYGAFLESSRTGAPVQRPLVFDHQDDATVLDLDDEYLLGRDLLVAPVTEPGMTARQVYLPSGGWVDWYDDTLLAGGRFVIASTPMDRIPLYARAGSVVPMWPEAPASTSGHRPRTLELHVFVPDVDGTHVSEVQEDDGLSLDAQNGAFVRTTVRLSRVGDRLTVEATVDGDGYDDFARTGVRLVLHGARARTAWLDGEPVQLASGGAEIAVEVPHTHDFTWEAVLA